MFGQSSSFFFLRHMGRSDQTSNHIGWWFVQVGFWWTAFQVMVPQKFHLDLDHLGPGKFPNIVVFSNPEMKQRYKPFGTPSPLKWRGHHNARVLSEAKHLCPVRNSPAAVTHDASWLWCLGFYFPILVSGSRGTIFRPWISCPIHHWVHSSFLGGDVFVLCEE